MDKKYWPFCVDDTTLNAQSKSELDFFKSCSSDGFESYIFGAGNLGASNKTGRMVEILFRGKRRWEVVLAECGKKKSATVVSRLDDGTRIAMNWLRGGNPV